MTAFIDDVNAYLAENPGQPTEAASALGCAVVEIEHHDSTRWSEVYHMVLQRKTMHSNAGGPWFEDEYVLVEYNEGSTEYQEDIHEEYPPTAFAVEPYRIEVVKYRPV